MLSINAGTALINGVRDPTQTGILFRQQEVIYALLPQLRAGRLDMFAEGLQDWFGQPAGDVFRRDRTIENLSGTLRVDALVETEDGDPAARVTGVAATSNGGVPRRLVIVDQNGIVRGIARFSGTEKWVDQLLYGRWSRRNNYLGYIRDYDRTLQYTAHVAARDTISDTAITIRQ